LPPLQLAHDPANIDANGFWYRNFQYAIEQERRLDYAEDLFSPCALTFDLNTMKKVNIIASTKRHDAANADVYRKGLCFKSPKSFLGTVSTHRVAALHKRGALRSCFVR